MSESKTTKFRLNPDNGRDVIRWETLTDGKNGKIVAFKIDILQINFLAQEENPDVESDKILEQEKQNFGEKKVAYEWENGLGF
jgi:hypothetical protein